MEFQLGRLLSRAMNLPILIMGLSLDLPFHQGILQAQNPFSLMMDQRDVQTQNFTEVLQRSLIRSCLPGILKGHHSQVIKDQIGMDLIDGVLNFVNGPTQGNLNLLVFIDIMPTWMSSGCAMQQVQLSMH